MLKIGITSGIGAGKTTVSKIFELLAVPVYYADERAKQLMNEDESLKNSILHHFGKEVYASGTLNRKMLSGIVFNDANKLALLNSLVHPATITDAEKWMLQQKTYYAIKEAAILFESGSNKQLDAVIGVSAPFELRLTRVMKRDNIPAKKVLERMNKQMPEDEKMKRCDYIIFNDEQQLLIPQVLELHNVLLKKAASQ
ncbi:MAG: dephospho-CoA kinase [Chitinophagaceae bacterium]|nr:dephospho-CoA kinase [Chitinophagaceae bacterium]